MLAGTAFSSAIALLAFASYVDAHGNLKEPLATFEDGEPTVEWVTLIENYWDIGSGGDQVGLYKTMAAEKKMSVRDVVLDMVKDKKCGYTRTDVDPQPIPADGKVKWLGNGGGGFTHTGPCEIYLGDTMVLHGDDCEAEFPGGPDGSGQTSDMPVDFAACNGDCTLSIYWLAFQNAQWQAYVNCVPIKGDAPVTQASTAGSSTEQQSPPVETQAAAGSSTEATEAPPTETGSAAGSSAAPPMETSAAGSSTEATEAPPTETSTGGSSTEQATEAPAAGSASTGAAPAATEAPAAETEAPTIPETKCNAPARRLRTKVAAL